MIKNNNLSLLAAGAITSIGIGTFFYMKQYLKNQKLSAYVEAMDNVLSKSSLMKNKKKSKLQSKKVDEKRGNHSDLHSAAADDIKAQLLEKRNRKSRQLLNDEHLITEFDEEDELKKSLDDFEQVINSKIKISSAHFEGIGNRQVAMKPRRKESATNEYSEMIPEQLQSSAGPCSNICLSRVDEEAYICFSCMQSGSKNTHNKTYLNEHFLSTQDEDDEDDEDQEEDLGEFNNDNNEEGEEYLNQQLDILGVQRGVSQIQIKKENKKRKGKKPAYPSLNQCQTYCWECVQEHHSNHLVCGISSQSSYISKNPNLTKSCSGSQNYISSRPSCYSPKLNEEQQLYLTAMKGQMEMQQMNSHAVYLYCCTVEQIQVTEENIPVQIENHLSQELNLIFDSFFDRVKPTHNEDFNNLLHIILKRIDEIMLDNNILIYIIGRILIKKNIIDRILRYDSLDSANQKKFSEILMKMAKLDSSLRGEIAVILLQDFKYVFVSHNLCSALLFLLKSPETRLKVTQQLKKASQLCAGLLNIKSIFKKFSNSTYKYRNKLLRCFLVTRALCEDRTFVVEGLLNKATKQFAELLCDVAGYLERNSEIYHKDFFKNIIHTGLGEEVFYLKNMDFHFRQIFHDFIQNAHYAAEKYRQLLWQKLCVYLKQNIEAFKAEIDNSEERHNTENPYFYLNITSLNMITIMERDIRCSKFELHPDDYAHEAQTILKNYLFATQEGYQILLLHHYSSVVNNPQNRCLYEQTKEIYGFPEIGDFDLVTLLQQQISDSNFVKELFMKHNFPSYDLYQNLRVLFTDYQNQIGQLLINILQINHQQLPLSLILKEMNKYVHVHSVSSLNLNIFCEQIPQSEKKNYNKKFQHEHIYKLKEIYYKEFFPLIFCKYPEDYEKLIKQQQLTCKLQQFDNHFSQIKNNSPLSGTSNSSEEDLAHRPKILNANFFNSKENNNDIFGSDYDFILVKDRLITFHQSILDIIVPTVDAFFMIEREDPLLCTIIQLYIRIILFQSEFAPSKFAQSTPYNTKRVTPTTISKLIPDHVIQKIKQYKSINKYLIEEIEYLKSSLHQNQSIKLKRLQSSSN